MNDCGAKSKLSAPLIYLFHLSKTGNYRWMTHAAASSFSNPLNPIIATTKPCELSWSKGGNCKKSHSSLAIRNHPGARGCVGFGPTCRPLIATPFCATAGWATCGPSLCRRASLPGGAGGRRPACVGPVCGTLLAHTRSRAVSLSVPVDARAIRPLGEPRRLSWLGEDPGDRCAAEIAGPQTLGQRTPQQHLRLQF